MPPNILDLGQIQLTSPADSLTISVSVSAHFQLPRTVSALDEGAFAEALRSRELWAIRGKSCHVGIKILVDSKHMKIDWRTRVLESLGYRLRNASLWSKLQLSTSLDITPQGTPDTPDIIFSLNRQTYTNRKTASGGDLAEDYDLRPPISIMYSELERISIQFDVFNTRNDLASERMKTWHPETESELMLLKALDEEGKSDALDHLEDVVQGLQDLSSSIAKVFEPSDYLDTEDDIVLLDSTWESQPCLSGALGISIIPPSAIVPEISTEIGLGKKGRIFPSKVTEPVRSRLNDHVDKPYPSRSEKEALMKPGGFRTTQSQQRMAEMLSTSSSAVVISKDKNLPPVDDIEPEDAEMLLTSCFTSRPSELLDPSSASAIGRLPKRRCPTNDLVDCSADPPSIKDIAIIIAIGEAALNALFSGYVGQSGEGLDALEVKGAFKSSLSNLVPTMFNPGFQKCMASNSVYLSTISNAVSISWTRNGQSPSLRQKLAQLAIEGTSVLLDETLEDTKRGTSERLLAVVQTRIWAMMQNHLYDRSATRRMWHKYSEERYDSPEMDNDPEPSETMSANPLKQLFGKDDNNFHDLLKDSEDDDLLDYMVRDEVEGLKVEQEIEKVFLGMVWQDREFLMDIDGSQVDDRMLL